MCAIKSLTCKYGLWMVLGQRLWVINKEDWMCASEDVLLGVCCNMFA